MATYCELMDVDTANVVAVYPSKPAALATVPDALERYGLAGVLDLALSEKTDDGSAALISESEDLALLADGAGVETGPGIAVI